MAIEPVEPFELSAEERKVAKIKAVLTRIVWQKDGRIIAKAQEPGRREVGVIGNMIDPQIGQMYEFSGEWQRNERYSCWDMRFFGYRTVMPTDSFGIFNYLVRQARWVGPETAQILIDKYGQDVLEIIKTDPDQIARAQIRGLTPERVLELSESLKSNAKLEAASIEVGNLIGATIGQFAVERAIRAWGSDAAHIIKRNPFKLTDLDGIGFMRADSVYAKLGLDATALRRHSRAVLHVLDELANTAGHTRVSRLSFTQKINQMVGVLNPRALEHCRRAKAIEIDDNWIASSKYAVAEQAIADAIRSLTMQQLPCLRISESIKQLTETLEDDQLVAFNKACDSPIMCLVGAPGTGKTYTVARIVSLWAANGLTPKMVAPTGKAAKQMTNAMASTVGLVAETIHSLLKAEIRDDGTFGFAFNESNKLTCRGIVIDEASMVDVRLANALFAALPAECRVLIVGDHYQLPSVGPGSVLRDILQSAVVPAVELRKIKRNAGLIVRSCHAIKDGKTPIPAPKLNLDEGDNWRHLEVGTTKEIIAVIEELLGKKLPSMNINPIWQTQIISPTNESGELSCAVLNRIAKGVVNPGVLPDKLPFAVGDKVVRTLNGKVKAHGDAKCGTCGASGEVNGDTCAACCGRGTIPQGSEVRIVNGDIGVVHEIDRDNVYVQFLHPDRRVVVPRKDHSMRMAYAMTCHKMQGSETSVVILPIRKSIMGLPMVTREWIYTALSRARTFIITIGQINYLPFGISKIGNTARSTSLRERLAAI